ncbi:phosphate-starvation-inducible E [Methylocucumis oryzae]|uniref:Protein PsiE n=1 Tax=Methylocucumis oryzae TaxID=1632867 RepID=A0A0F3IFL3_9GAMM|nr:phosphate-starvation-inducible E [Methylocucumis oryzae]
MAQIRSHIQLGKAYADELDHILFEVFHYLALFVIGASIVWSAVIAYWGMVVHGHATISDILLLFIYLELGAMVGIYFKTSAMPVRCLIFVAITALSRLLIADVQAHHQESLNLLWVSGAIVLLALSTLLIRTSSLPSSK